MTNIATRTTIDTITGVIHAPPRRAGRTARREGNSPIRVGGRQIRLRSRAQKRRRSPDARPIGRAIAARTASSVPTSRTRTRARVTAV
ncbi:hypothetical protein GCM10023203_40960 [Actinomycetospora straminea]|uniref:Uncharacterized protein n=1 Tax=Actinomycetospora straminea TaxID=663607 RepID=A0ABP9EZK0_9PSEU